MKVTITKRGGLKAAFGPLMWRCSGDKHPNYRYEFSLNCGFYNHHSGPWLLLPTITVMAWQKSILATIEPLGIKCHSTRIAFEWLNINWGILFMSCQNTKTQEEVNKAKPG